MIKHKIIVKNMPFSLALDLLGRGCICVRECENAIRSGTAPGIDISNIAWLKEEDILAHDWMLLDCWKDEE